MSRAHVCCVDLKHPRRVAALTSITPIAAAATIPDAIRHGHPDDALAETILGSLDDAKADDILTIALAGKTTIADFMIIATGRSTTHVNAIADRVIRSCKDKGSAVRIEGMPQNDWVLLDAGDVIVHVFRPEVRQFYNLEKMWGVDRPSERRTG